MAGMVSGRIGFLDGLRGWGAVIVLLHHVGERFLVEADGRIMPTWSRFIYDGPFAVLVFFVVSGFALSHVNFGKTAQNLRIATLSRYFRLAIPIFVTSFVGYAMLKAGLFANIETSKRYGISETWLGQTFVFDPSFLSFVKFSLYNVFFDYVPGTSYNTSLWTLSIELFGSMLVYSYLSLFRRDGSAHLLMAFALFCLLLKIAPYYACFIGGYLAAEAYARLEKVAPWRVIVESLAGIGFYAVVFLITMYRPTNLGMLCALATVFVFSVAFSSPLRWLLTTRVSEFLGRISFPLYLIHLYVICSWSVHLFTWLEGSMVPTIPALLINILSTFAIAAALSIALIPLERFSVRSSKLIASTLLGRESR
jgi:peptidoglycan/LPS O-acetylase OafA/YrhL